MDSQTIRLLTSMSLMAFAIGCVLIQKKRVTAELRKARRKKKELGNVNIGGMKCRHKVASVIMVNASIDLLSFV